jgi:phage recombination protein Bet
MTTKSTTKAPALRQATEFSQAQIGLIKRTICKDASDDELRLFLAQCRRTGLDPFARQIFAVKRWDSREKREVMQTQTSIDGLRLTAERSGKYAGQTEPQWCGPDGKWLNAWLSEEPPAAARIGVLRPDFREPCYAVARYGAYVQMRKEGGPNAMWARMPDVMLSKCAEALALRKSFPMELSGLYSAEELGQADGDADPQPAVNSAPGPPKAQANDDVPARPWADYKQLIDAFSLLHGRLGVEHDHVYREVLREFNVNHSNEFSDYRTARAAYRKLRAKVEEIEAAIEQKTAEEIERVAEGDELQPDSEAAL